jgi:uncharacterized RDD family membrane protein YckC
MKCPKCGYLGFEHVERCRNCGYDFSLAPRPAEPELPIKSDLAALDDDFALPDIPLTPPRPSELPLFDEGEPLITKPSPPRPPLAVRRSTPEIPRARIDPRELDLGFDTKPLEPLLEPDRRAAAANWGGAAAADPALEPTAEPAGLAARLGAALIDLVILAVVDAAVVYLTLQICNVAFDEIGIVPKVPLAAFLLVQNLGYLVAFTAGGQTLGKMAMGIRVVPADEFEALDVGHAMLRTLVWVALAVPAGLGFLSALPARDRRGLHDRFAGTRVVRA